MVEMPEGAAAEESDDEKAAKSDRDATLQALKAENVTLGAWLANREADAAKGAPPKERRRGIHANRSVVQDEFNRLWNVQAAHHAILRDERFRAEVEDVIFSQRPVFWRKNTLGECRFMPGEALCPKGAWISQEKRMLEKVNNLALAGGNARPLDVEERAAILEKLQTQATMSWSGVRRSLKDLYKLRGDAGAEKGLRFNLELGGDKGLLGNAVEAKLFGIFGRDWLNHPHKQAIRDAIHRRLWSADYGEIGEQRIVILPGRERKERRAAAAQSFINDFGVSSEQAQALQGLHFPTGWEPYSTKALQEFLPHLEARVRFGALVNGPEWEDWRTKTFPNRDRPTGEFYDKLPSPAERDERERIAKLRNPTVVRTQNELRKVVNNLIGLYGKPDLIRVEVAREVGRSKRDREEAHSAIRRREKRRKDAIKDLQSKGIAEPSRDDVEKWLLWEECNNFDPYSGKAIGFDDLFRNNIYQVEHIWPRKTSLDNSFANKTLCHRDWNTRKGKQTPFAAFCNADEWEDMKRRVWKHVAAKRMSRGKARRFCREEDLPDDFASRQLNDTGYASRQAVAFLKRLWPDMGPEAPVTVQAVTGRVTAQLRRLWNLNNILSDDGKKTRADHRHHAIDALTVACAHPGMTNRLSRYWQMKDDPRANRPDLPPPWPTIRADAEKAKDKIVVSHRVRKKVSGPLHAETSFGDTLDEEVKNGTIFGVYVKKMPVEKLSLATLRISHVSQITKTAKFVVRDEAVRRALADHLERAGGEVKNAYPPYPLLSQNGPEIRKVRVLSLHQKNLMAPVAMKTNGAGEREPTGFADLANNHHIALYSTYDGKAEFEIVSLHEASRRLARKAPVVRRERNGARFVMSLAPGEAVEFLQGERKGIWIVRGAWANGQVVLTRDTDARPSSKTEADRLHMDGVREEFRPKVSRFLSNTVQKISIDPIGRIRPAND